MMRSCVVVFFVAAAVASAAGSPLVAIAAATSSTVQPNIETSINLQAAGKPVPPMFMGYSIEWGLIGQLLGRQDGRFRVTENSIKRLETFTGPMLLRIGGNSEDEAAFHLPTIHHLPKYVHINITAATLKKMRQLAQATGCRYILGLNLGADKPALAVRLVKACLQYIGRRHIAAFEIGNEPDDYGRFGGIWRHDSYPLYLRRWTRTYHAIAPLLGRSIKIEGPAFGGYWLSDLPAFLKREHTRLSIVSLHRYPLGAPIRNPKSPIFASIHNLLKASTADGYGREMNWAVKVAAPYHLPVRFGEMNNAWDGGKEGVSNTYASTLWAASALLDIARAGGAGVNLHMSQGIDQFGGWYGPLRFGRHGHLHRMPEYYGMLAAADVIQHGGRPLRLALRLHANVSLFAFLSHHQSLRIAAINRTPDATVNLNPKLPTGMHLIHWYRMDAPTLYSTGGITIAGYGAPDDLRSRLLNGQLRPLPRKYHTGTFECPPQSISIFLFRR
ncbi:MAG: hypothetical protein ACP5O1_05430 [Phycisphaerae bacterium]